MLASAIVVFVVAGTVGAAARPLDPASSDWEGLAELLDMLALQSDADRVSAVGALDFQAMKPMDSVLLVHPVARLDVTRLEAFLEAGGRVALLDDFGSGERLLSGLGLRRVALPARPAQAIRSNAALALAEAPSGPPSESLRALGFARTADPVVTNHATGVAGDRLQPLLVVRGDGEPDVALGAVAPVGKGFVVAIGDSSVAMNSMLQFPGNRTLATWLARYLTDAHGGGAGGAAGHVYVLSNATPVERARNRSGLSDLLPGLATDATDALERGGSGIASYLAALAVALGMVVWTSFRAGRLHRRSLPRFARAAPPKADTPWRRRFVARIVALAARPSPSPAHDLRVAIEVRLAAAAGVAPGPAGKDLVARVRACGRLSEPDAEEAGDLLERLARAEARTRWLGLVGHRLVRPEVVRLADRAGVLLSSLGDPVSAAPRPARAP